MKRPAHKVAHAACPYGVFNWGDCDAAASHRWGRCVALVEGKGEPHACTNWAVAEDGWCGQHFIALHEKTIRKAREAERQLQWRINADAFMAKTASPDYNWWSGLATSVEGTRGLAGIGEPVLLSPARRKPPHRLTELA